MGAKRTIYSRPIPQNPPLDGPVLLKDGRPAYLRRARPEDRPAFLDFLARVSDESLAYRFFGRARRGDELVERLIAPELAQTGLSLVVTVGEAEKARIVGVGSYERRGDAPVAEVAFLVEDRYQGRGIGMLLLERLAMGAEDEGLDALEAVVMPENHRMLRIFTDSGYEITRELDGGDILITFSIAPTRASVEKYEARDRVATVASLIPFFHPRSIAVVGASRDPEQIGHRVLYNLVRSRFAGPVYPVNPRADTVSSMRAYPSVLDLPDEVDLAVVAVPPEEVLGVVDHCAEKRIRGLIVLTAGFAESGPNGRVLQERLVRKVRANGMRLIGPNCLGLINTDGAVRLHATFVEVTPRAGRVAMSSQSGALGLAVLEYAQELGLGFSSFVGIGNKADVSGNDLLQYWEEDAATDVILLYLESFGNPRRFANLARRIGAKKPILAVKGGRTRAGQRAAGSHTAAAAADDTVVEAFFEQTGVVRCDTLEEMFDVALLLTNQPLPHGGRVAILTNSGGPAILCADACEANGLELPPLRNEERRLLSDALPTLASVENPVDMSAFATAEAYYRALSVLLKAETIDAVIVMFTPIGTADAADVQRAICAAVEEHEPKPVLACFMGIRGMTQRLQTSRGMIPSYRFPESAARALGHAAKYAAWRRRPRSGIVDFSDIDWQQVEHHLASEVDESGWLSRPSVDATLKAIGLNVAQTSLVRSAEEAAAAAEALGFPVVVRPEGGRSGSDAWTGVHINLESAADVRRAFNSVHRTLRRRADEASSILVQPMVPQGVDMTVRIIEEPGFGPVLAFGLRAPGGEVRDSMHRIMPLTENDAGGLVAAYRSRLTVAPGGEGVELDWEAVEEALLRLSRLVHEYPRMDCLELSPLRIFAHGKGYTLLDARIRLSLRRESRGK